MTNGYLIYSLIVNIVVFTWIFIILYYRYVSNARINELLEEYFTNEGFEIIEISKFSITEKINYGVPLNFITRINGLVFTFNKLGDNHYRKVEVTDKSQNEQLLYVELYIRKRNLINCNVFKRYKY